MKITCDRPLGEEEREELIHAVERRWLVKRKKMTLIFTCR